MAQALEEYKFLLRRIKVRKWDTVTNIKVINNAWKYITKVTFAYLTAITFS